MSCFPLYDNLVSQKKAKRLTLDEKRRFIEQVKGLDQDGHHKVLAIIIYYQKKHNLPCIEPSANVEVNLTSLPNPLQELLELFVTKHISFMEDESRRRKEIKS